MAAAFLTSGGKFWVERVQSVSRYPYYRYAIRAF